MTKQQQFHDFCIEQIDRLGGAFPDFRFYKPAAVDELVAWLESKAAGDKQNAMVFITEVTQFENLPRIADLNALWGRLHAPPQRPVASAVCPFCTGTGWEDREGVLKRGIFAGESFTFAVRCRCGGMPPTVDPTVKYEPDGKTLKNIAAGKF